MSKRKRIILTILAWIITHFTLHIVAAATSPGPPPTGLIAFIDLCVAGFIYYLTGKNKRT